MVRLEDLAGEFADLYDIDLAAARTAVSVHTDQMIDDPRLYQYIEGTDELLTEEGAAVLRKQMSEVYGCGSPERDEARDAVRSAVGKIEEHTGQRDAAIRAALTAGVPVKHITEDSGLSRARVYQIRDGRR